MPRAKKAKKDTAEQRLQRFLAEAGKRRFVPPAPVQPSADEVELLTFILGGSQYAIEIEDVAEIAALRPATRVPNAATGTVGIMSLRGSMVTLLDVRSRLKHPPRGAVKDPRVIVVRETGGLVGFEVDRVLRPARFDRGLIEPPQAAQNDFVRGVIQDVNSLTIVLDLAKLLG